MKITLAIPKGKDYRARLKQELALASNIKSKQNKEQVEHGLSRIISVYQEGKAYLYDGDTNDLNIYEYPLKEFIYYCGRYFITPEGVSFGNKYLLVVMDANQATIGLLDGKSIKILWDKESYVPGKQDSGGQSERRFERAREEKKKQWLKEVAEKMKEISLKR